MSKKQMEDLFAIIDDLSHQLNIAERQLNEHNEIFIAAGKCWLTDGRENGFKYVRVQGSFDNVNWVPTAIRTAKDQGFVIIPDENRS